MTCSSGDLRHGERARHGSVTIGDLTALAEKWIGHFDALALANEPNCSIYWECARDLLAAVQCNSV